MTVLVSACLLGENCKYNGGNNASPAILKFLKDKQVIPICPELLAGMPSPRPPVEIKDARDVYKRQPERFAAAYLAEMQEFIDCICENRKPGVSVYDGTKSTAIGFGTTEAWKSGKVVAL